MSDSRELPCRRCGAPLTFQPGVGKLVCPFCGTSNEIKGSGRVVSPWGVRIGADTGITERDFEQALRTLAEAGEIEETAALGCPGCGAQVSLDATTLAANCPFCDTPLARAAKATHRHPRPQAVLPFAITEPEARGRMKRWLGSLWFAPSKLKKYAQSGRPLSGVYLPHYTYDAEGEADYTGQRGDAYYVTRTRMVDGKMQTYQQRRVRWMPAAGRVRHAFDDVLVPASGNAGAGRPEYGGRSWDLVALEAYRTEYLAGFRAEMPTLGLDEGFVQASQVMEGVLSDEVRADIGGDEQRITSMQSRFSDITFKHVLLPVWLASYRFRDRVFQVAINGRTGEVTGERPYSTIKIAIAVVLALIALGVVGYVAAITR
ncbi:MAG TPA: primosomal protein N' (replication factor Y) - superfamily II helicase [Paracoccaceae bacterium]|nr:primosomal protein N' (replication factor Y) - superfamily II helicase [Paracoccaceae bacterium]